MEFVEIEGDFLRRRKKKMTKEIEFEFEFRDVQYCVTKDEDGGGIICLFTFFILFSTFLYSCLNNWCIYI